MNLEDSVDIVCNLRSVDIAFSRQIVRSPELLIGKEVTLQVLISIFLFTSSRTIQLKIKQFKLVGWRQ